MESGYPWLECAYQPGPGLRGRSLERSSATAETRLPTHSPHPPQNEIGERPRGRDLYHPAPPIRAVLLRNMPRGDVMDEEAKRC